MKVVGYTALHYGAEWLSWAIRSVRDIVDEVVVVYSPTPSYGHQTSKKCPESPEMLRYLATRSGAVFYQPMVMISNESEHRQLALDYCKHTYDPDLVLVLDADEVWDSEHLEACIREISNASIPKRNWRVPMRHFWRSVGWVCEDPAMPVRFIDMTEPNNESDGYLGKELGIVNHFGYAQTPTIVDYKWRIHGHQNELRPGWFENKFLMWSPGMDDVHPTNENFWDPRPFNRNVIGHLIGDHPYFHKEFIQ